MMEVMTIVMAVMVHISNTVLMDPSENEKYFVMLLHWFVEPKIFGETKTWQTKKVW